MILPQKFHESPLIIPLARRQGFWQPRVHGVVARCSPCMVDKYGREPFRWWEKQVYDYTYMFYIYITTNGHFSTGMHIQVRTCVWQVLSTCIFVCICPMRLHWESFGCHQDLLTLDAEAKWSPKLHGFCFEAFTPNKLTLSGHEIGFGQPSRMKQIQPHYLFRMSSGVLFLLHVALCHGSCWQL